MPFSPDSGASLVWLRKLVAGYGGRTVLRDVSLELYPGEIVAVLGHNASGKSTLLRTLVGLVRPTSGEGRILETSLGEIETAKLLRSGVRYLPQGKFLFLPLTLKENLALHMGLIHSRLGTRSALRLAAEVGNSLGLRLRQRAASLSGGERKRASLALLFQGCPRILLLDEPALGLAPRLARACIMEIAAMAREAGSAIIVVEQRVKEVLSIATRVYVLRQGAVCFEGAPEELADPKRLRALLTTSRHTVA